MKAKSKKEIIFIEAAELFKSQGYQATSMRELATKVGIEPSSLYSHIKSKEEILIKICFETAEVFLAGIEKIRTEITGPVDQVKAIISLHVDVAVNHSSSITVFNDEWRNLSQKKLDEFLSLRKKYEDHINQILKDGEAKKVFRKTHPKLTQQTILSSIQWIYAWYKPARQVSVDEIKNELFQALIPGLCAV